MQRTIKFRGKTKVGKEWVYGYVYETQIFIDGNPCQDVMIIDDFTVIPETVGQFTGLKDKNGKEIYEGDILGYECKIQNKEFKTIKVLKEHFVVSFGEYNTDDYEDRSSISWLLGGVPLTEDRIFAEYNNPYWDLMDGNVSLKTIGNIHDNPELLGGSK